MPVLITCWWSRTRGTALFWRLDSISKMPLSCQPPHISQTLFVWWLYSHIHCVLHDDIIKWKHFPHYWPFVGGIHRSPVNSPHKGQWCGALIFSLICSWINDWVNNREAGDLRCHHPHYDITVMMIDEALKATVKSVQWLLMSERLLGTQTSHYELPMEKKVPWNGAVSMRSRAGSWETLSICITLRHNQGAPADMDANSLGILIICRFPLA